MKRLNNIYRIWRLAALVLLILAFLGPWLYDRIVVPAQYACNPPAVRLNGDFCGIPMPGVWVIVMLVGGLFTQPPPEEFGWVILMAAFALVLVQPLFITLYLVVRGRNRRSLLWGLSWGLAAALVLWQLRQEMLSFDLSGVWLYLAIALLGLVLEAITFAAGFSCQAASAEKQ